VVAAREIRSWLSGVTAREDAERHPYVPSRIVASVAELVADLG
jgi:hypothetical protein